MIYTYDERGILKSANRATAEHLGAPVERLLGSSALDFMTHASAAGFRERIERLRREGEIEEEVEAVRADGERRYVRFRNRRLDLDGGELFLGTAIDVTERRRLEELLREQALRDPLTGLANRRLLDDHFAQALAWAERRRQRGERDRVAVLALDLDGSKTVNDALGHAAGDRLLVAVARAVEPLLAAADRALYAAKSAGRRCFRFPAPVAPRA
jgi:PAS domain S-box-containing protein